MVYAPYSRPGTPFGAPGEFYTPGVGHRGQDYYASAGSPVVAYEDMTIEYVGRTSGLGTVLGARLAADGKHAGWAHLRNVRSFANGWVPAGTQFAEVAGAGDSPGSLWAGAHIHTTLTPVSSSSFAAANGNTPLEDPAPRIAAAPGSASAGRPVPLPEEEDMTSAIIYDKGRGAGDSTAFLIDLVDPTRPLAKATEGDYASAVGVGLKVIAVESSAIQSLLRSRGLFKQDGGFRIAPYSPNEISKLTEVEKQYAINHGGFLAVRAAG